MDEHGGVAAVVDDDIGPGAVAVIGEAEHLEGAPPVLVERLALPGEDGRAVLGDGRGGVVLRGVDVAGGPADVGAQRLERLDEHRGLDGHVERAGDAGALEGLLLCVLLADGHQAGHLGFGDVDLVIAVLGEADILDFMREGGGLGSRGGRHDVSSVSVGSDQRKVQ